MNIRHLILMGLTFAGTSSAQSIIGQARFTLETDPPDSLILAPQAFIKRLPPMPKVDLFPPQMPPEFFMSSEKLADQTLLQEADTSIREGNLENAHALFRAYLEKHPEDLRVHVALASSLFTHKAYEESEKEYLAVLEKLPLDFRTLNNLAWLYCTSPLPEQQKPETALQLATRARTLNPQSHHVWSTLSMAYYRMGEYRKALDHATVTLQLAERSPSRTKTILNYLLQLDKCRMALEATTILE